MIKNVDFKILFDDGKRYYCPQAPGIVSSLFESCRVGSEECEPEEVRFKKYSNVSFRMLMDTQTTFSNILSKWSLISGLDLDRVKDIYGKLPIATIQDGNLLWIDNQLCLVSDLFQIEESEQIVVFLIFNCQAGNIWNENGIRYDMHSREKKQHHTPHIHVKYRDNEASVSLITGEIEDGLLPNKIHKVVKNKILNNQFFLLDFWNNKTDGIKVDLNVLFGETEVKI